MEAVVCRVQFPAGVGAGLLGPALVLGLQHLTREVAKFDQGAHPSADQRAAGPEFTATVNDRNGLTVGELVDAAVVDEETAFGDVPIGRRRDEHGR